MTSLLVSGFVTNPGLYSIDDGVVSRLDDVASTGLCQTEWGLFRARFSRTECVVDRIVDGAVVATFSVPHAAQPHGLAVDGDKLLLVDTVGNRVLWLDPLSGEVTRQWQASIVPDAWHLNSLTRAGEHLAVSCFGRFEVADGGTKIVGSDGWWGAGPDNRGEIVDIVSGATVLGGLSAPHSPVMLDDGWLLCESFRAELALHPIEGEPRRVVLGGWPRGLHVEGRTAYVGVSDSEREPNALPPHGASPGKVVTVDLDAWLVTDEVELPCSGVFDVVAR